MRDATARVSTHVERRGRRGPGTRSARPDGSVAAPHASTRAGARCVLAPRPPAERRARRTAERERRARRRGRRGTTSVTCSFSGATRWCGSASAQLAPAGSVEREEEPQALDASSSRRIMCIATVVERSRTSAREPGSTSRRSRRRPSSWDTLKQTVPTGFSSVPPPGPAIPVIPTPTDAPSARPGAVGQRRRDLVGDRADALDQRRVDARQRHLGLVGVDDQPAQHVRRGARAGRSAGPPAARPCRTPPSRSSRRSPQQRRHLLVDRRAVVGERRSWRALERPRRTPRTSAAASGANTVAISISPRRRQVVISSDAGGVAAPPACARSPTPGCPKIRSIPLAQLPRPGQRGAHRLRLQRRLPHRLQLARRAGQHEDRRAVPRPGPRAPAPSRPARAPSPPAGPSPACGCPPGSRPGRGRASAR